MEATGYCRVEATAAAQQQSFSPRTLTTVVRMREPETGDLKPTQWLGVFCGSYRGNVDAVHLLAAELGAAMAKTYVGLVYGGGGIGVMGTIADAVLAAGGYAIGVVPTNLMKTEMAHTSLDEPWLPHREHDASEFGAPGVAAAASEIACRGGGTVGACRRRRVLAIAGTLGMAVALSSACLYASDVSRVNSAMRLRLSPLFTMYWTGSVGGWTSTGSGSGSGSGSAASGGAGAWLEFGNLKSLEHRVLDKLRTPLEWFSSFRKFYYIGLSKN